MEPIYHNLEKYCNNDYVPMHMPGHKRNISEFFMQNPYKLDITEIDGFDNLHNPQGIIKESMVEAAKMYGADKTFYLVNGSSVGLLAAISAVTQKRNKVLVARNCHRSVYHAIFLNELEPVYIYPEYNKMGIFDGISCQIIDRMLKEHKDIQAVIITSPTYEGVVSEVVEIANLLHRYGIPLVVDEAHGAHFGFHESFPKSALTLGADIVVQSIHKTLPAFTQTALLHIKSRLVNTDKVKDYLDMYQTTSPSYLLLAGIDKCMDYLRTKGAEKFSNYVENLNKLIKKINELQHIKLFRTDDISKLVIYLEDGYLNGKQLYDILLDKYKIQLEMASFDYVIAMTTVGDRLEYYNRFIHALQEIDMGINASTPQYMKSHISNSFDKKVKSIPAIVIKNPYDAMQSEKDVVLLKNSIGRISACSVCVYPPGSPIVFAGELITKEIIDYIINSYELGLEVIGLENIGLENIGLEDIKLRRSLTDALIRVIKL